MSDLLGTISPVFGAINDINQAKQQAAVLNLQARQSDLNARNKRLQGKREVVAIQQNLEKDLASQNALFGVRGMIQSEGSANAARESSRVNAGKDIDLARFDAEIVALNSDQESINLRSEAKATKRAGYVKAFGRVANAAIGAINPTAGITQKATTSYGHFTRTASNRNFNTLLKGL